MYKKCIAMEIKKLKVRNTGFQSEDEHRKIAGASRAWHLKRISEMKGIQILIFSVWIKANRDGRLAKTKQKESGAVPRRLYFPALQ